MSFQRPSPQRIANPARSLRCEGYTPTSAFPRKNRHTHVANKPFHLPLLPTSLSCLLFLLCTQATFADTPPSAANLAAAGDTALESNDNALAIVNYTAIDQPSAETTYNLGIAHYRNGEMQQAAEQFRKVIGSQNDSVAARARFNLGNAFYSQALTQLTPPSTDEADPVTAQPTAQTGMDTQDVEAGTKLLRGAITQYRSSLRINANDNDARANIELAQSLIDQIQQQQDQQQQDQQQQDQENKSNQKITNAEEQADSKDDSDDSSDPPSGELTAVNEQDAATDQAHGEPTLIKTDQMTEEEARKLLQSIRDRDMLRRLRKQAAERALRVPVERDW